MAAAPGKESRAESARATGGMPARASRVNLVPGQVGGRAIAQEDRGQQRAEDQQAGVRVGGCDDVLGVPRRGTGAGEHHGGPRASGTRSGKSAIAFSPSSATERAATVPAQSAAITA